MDVCIVTVAWRDRPVEIRQILGVWSTKYTEKEIRKWCAGFCLEHDEFDINTICLEWWGVESK